MKAAWCRAPGIYGQEHLGKHGKGRRRGGGGVRGGATESGADTSRGERRWRADTQVPLASERGDEGEEARRRGLVGPA